MERFKNHYVVIFHIEVDNKVFEVNMYLYKKEEIRVHAFNTMTIFASAQQIEQDAFKNVNAL